MGRININKVEISLKKLPSQEEYSTKLDHVGLYEGAILRRKTSRKREREYATWVLHTGRFGQSRC